jgi:phosphoglycolate phosphatase
MKKLSLKAVVFDFDGTLAKLNIDFSLMRQGVLELLSGYGVPPDGLRDLLVLEMIAAGRTRLSRMRPGKDREFLKIAHAQIAEIEVRAARRGALFDGVRDMLRELRARNIGTGVVTRNCLAAVEALFPDIHHRVDAVITREGTPNVKPHPEHLRRMLKQLAVPPAQAAMIGDHPMDIRTGREAGVYAIGVLTGHSKEEDLQQAGADLLLKGATDILDVLA